MKYKIFVVSALAVLVVGCSKSDPGPVMSPDQTFQTYNNLLIDGIGFEESKKFHSKAMTAKVEKQIAAMQKNNGNSIEAFFALYSRSLSQMAKCAELTLASEKIEGKTAHLVYDRKDVCGEGKITPAGEQIRMVYEDGWKIDDNLTVYSD